MFSSEHIAGTEFVLGTLLVLHGVTAFDVFAGLAVGNLLAVLSWALMCAPIAVKERLTIYWQIRKPCRALLNGYLFRHVCTDIVSACRIYGECFHNRGFIDNGNSQS